jgi:hypothetical protein
MCSKANKARDFIIWDFMIKGHFGSSLKEMETPHDPKPKIKQNLINIQYCLYQRFQICNFFFKEKNNISLKICRILNQKFKFLKFKKKLCSLIS